MNIAIIYGDKDVGKSTTCRKLLKVLVSLNARVLYYQEFEWGDFKANLQLADKNIAIYSAGDEKGHLQGAIEYGRTCKCDYLICCERKYIHYSETIDGLNPDEHHEWLTLDVSVDNEEKDVKQNKMVSTILNSLT